MNRSLEKSRSAPLMLRRQLTVQIKPAQQLTVKSFAAAAVGRLCGAIAAKTLVAEGPLS